MITLGLFTNFASFAIFKKNASYVNVAPNKRYV